MHTDGGTSVGDGQTLRATALFYLNASWKPGDGGELRLFPYPHKPEVTALHFTTRRPNRKQPAHSMHKLEGSAPLHDRLAAHPVRTWHSVL